MKNDLVSIIITTKNSAKTLKSLLVSIKKQSYKRKEIIIVDNNSSDKTLNIAKKYTENIFLKGPERSSQRNYGALKSKGNYLFFLDSDMVLEEHVIKQCVEKSKYKLDKCEVIVPEKSFGKGFWAKAKILERNINEGEFFFEAARFFPKKIFKQAKGYDESLTGPEEKKI